MMKNKIILSFVLSILLFAVGVSATVGVTSFYYDKNPLIVNPGETKEISFGLQNHGGDADATVKVELADGFNIAEFTDENLEYFIELDGDDVSVPLTIKIPEDAQPGQEWSVGASFSIKYRPRSWGALQISSTYFKDFKVIVKSEVPTTQATKTIIPSSPLVNLIVLIVVLVLLILLMKAFSKKK